MALGCAALALVSACGGDDSEAIVCESFDEITNDEFVGGAIFLANTCYLVNEDLLLDDGTVTVEHGVSFQFATNVAITIKQGGRFNILGTEDRPVRLVSQDPAITWQGVSFEDSQGTDNVWSYVELENAGSDTWTGAAYSASALYLTGSSNLSMDHVTIRASESHGLMAFGDVDFSFTNGVLESNEYPAYVHPAVAHHLGAETVFTDNVNQYLRVVIGNTDRQLEATTWSALTVPYRIENRFYVAGDLTLEAGVVLEFFQGAELIVEAEGTLTAVGTAEAPIAFRGAAPTRGYWKGVQLMSGGTGTPAIVGATFDFCEFSETGSDSFSGRVDSVTAIYMASQSGAQISNSLFYNNELYGLWASEKARLIGFGANIFMDSGAAMLLHPDRVGELEGTSTFSGNDVAGVHVVFGNNDRVSVPATWQNLGVPYLIESRFSVEAALTIEAGTAFLVGQDIGIFVKEEGSLTTSGTQADPVRFEGQNPIENGYWKGISFDSNSAANQLRHTDVLHAGSTTWTGAPESDAGVFLYGEASVSLSNVTLGRGGGYGVYKTASAGLTCSDVAFVSLVKGNARVSGDNTIYAGCP